MKKSKIFFLKPHPALTLFVSCGVIRISCRWRGAQADAIVNVRFSYIPALLIGIPYVEGDLVKYK